MFCTKNSYIEMKYCNNNLDVQITNKLKEDVIATVKHIISMAKMGINILFYYILEMKEKLLLKKILYKK